MACGVAANLVTDLRALFHARVNFVSSAHQTEAFSVAGRVVGSSDRRRADSCRPSPKPSDEHNIRIGRPPDRSATAKWTRRVGYGEELIEHLSPSWPRDSTPVQAKYAAPEIV